MGNPFLTFDAKDALVIWLLAHGVTDVVLMTVASGLWMLSHLGVWR